MSRVLPFDLHLTSMRNSGQVSGGGYVLLSDTLSVGFLFVSVCLLVCFLFYFFKFFFFFCWSYLCFFYFAFFCFYLVYLLMLVHVFLFVFLNSSWLMLLQLHSSCAIMPLCSSEGPLLCLNVPLFV